MAEGNIRRVMEGGKVIEVKIKPRVVIESKPKPKPDRLRQVTTNTTPNEPIPAPLNRG